MEEAIEITEGLEEKESKQELKQMDQAAAPQRSQHNNAGMHHYNGSYDWNFLNLSVVTAVRDFGAEAEKACVDELTQLFKVKRH